MEHLSATRPFKVLLFLHIQARVQSTAKNAGKKIWMISYPRVTFYSIYDFNQMFHAGATV